MDASTFLIVQPTANLFQPKWSTCTSIQWTTMFFPEQNRIGSADGWPAKGWQAGGGARWEREERRCRSGLEVFCQCRGEDRSNRGVRRIWLHKCTGPRKRRDTEKDTGEAGVSGGGAAAGRAVYPVVPVWGLVAGRAKRHARSFSHRSEGLRGHGTGQQV